jgi:predicted Zn-dependent protease
VAKSFEDITPEQEYYIGRTVGAVIVNKYRVYPNTEANEYLNLLGQTLAQASDRPETFGGYHFLILDSGEINAFAAPGGLIFVSRGMLRNCKSEDAVAAVLAHEIGHVQLRHGLQSIDRSRLTQALTTLAAEGAKTFGKKELADLTRAFEGSITDITSTMINNGYSRAFEREADAAAIQILSRVGYDPNGLVAMLSEMEKNLKPGGLDFAKTHPSPRSRIDDIRSLNVGGKPYQEVSARQARFRKALGNI